MDSIRGPVLILPAPEHERIEIVVSVSVGSGATNDKIGVRADKFRELIEAMVATDRSAAVDAMTEAMPSLAPVNCQSAPD